MIYSSGLQELKKVLNIRNYDDFHAATPEELTFESFKGYFRNSKIKGDVDKEGKLQGHSSEEKSKFKAIDLEETARKEQIEQMESRAPASPTPQKAAPTASSSSSSSSAVGTAPTSPKSPTMAHTNKESAGYHSVQIPLSDKASQELQAFKSSTNDWVELSIVGIGAGKESEKVDATASKSKPTNLPSLVHEKEPRFYLLRTNAGKILFAYCCPEKSPPKLRMVYSTAKPAVTNYVTKMGIKQTKNVEISQPSDLSDDGIKELLSSSSSGTGGGGGAGTGGYSSQKKPASPTQHPVYSLINGGESTSSTKKKIVMPPSGAYM